MLRFKASFYLYKYWGTKTRDCYPGLLQSLVSCLLSSIPRIVTRSPAALTVPVLLPLVTKSKSLPCVILIIDHVISQVTCCCQPHPSSLSQANAYSAHYTCAADG